MCDACIYVDWVCFREDRKSFPFAYPLRLSLLLGSIEVICVQLCVWLSLMLMTILAF